MLALVARHRPLLDAVLPRFSRLAGWCLGAVAVTGLLNALLRLGSWSNLLLTDYGRIVLAKTDCLVLLALLGNLARRRLADGRTIRYRGRLDDQYAALGERRSQVDGGRRLADPALLVHDGEDASATRQR